MIIYGSMILIAIAFAYVAQKMKSKNKVVYYVMASLSALPFFVVSAFRYDVGTDYFYRYMYDYLQMKNGYSVNNLEVGFQVIDRIALFFNYSQLIFIITSLIITVLVFSTIYRDSKNPILSILLFFIGAFFFQSLNMTRQYISISLLFFSYKYFINKRWLVFLIYLGIACMFHTTAILFAVFLMIGQLLNILYTKNISIVILMFIVINAIILICGSTFNILINYVLSLTRYKVYINSVYSYGDLQIIPYTKSLLIILFMLVTIKKNKIDLDGNIAFFINMQMFSVIFFALGSVSFLGIRLAYYFLIFEVLSIPFFLEFIKNKSKKVYIILLAFIILLNSGGVLWTHVIHNSDEVLPYKCCFFKEVEVR